MAQMELFGELPRPRVRRYDPLQSVNAARRTQERLPSRRERILECFDFQPLCDDELCILMKEEPRWWPSIKTARSGLKKDGLLVPTGFECREHHQMVWRRTDRPNHARIEPTRSL